MDSINFDENYYDVLCVDENSSDKDIKKAYYKLAKKSHPDANKNINSNDRFKRICDAYEILGNKEKKDMYDRVRSINEEKKENYFTDTTAFHKMLGMHDSSESMRAINIIIDVTIEEIYNCATKSVQIDKVHPCEMCDGQKIDIEKYLMFPKKYLCAKCIGRGFVNVIQVAHHTRIDIPMPCPQCNGEKIILRPEILCTECCGEGVEEFVEIFNYKLNHNTKNGSAIKLSRLGNQMKPCDTPGDVIITVNQLDHPQFRMSKNGKDLLMVEKMSLYDALGCNGYRTIEIKTISGNIMNIDIPQKLIIKPGQVKLIKGAGMRNTSMANGDLYIVFEVVFPDSLNNDKMTSIKSLLGKGTSTRFSKENLCLSQTESFLRKVRNFDKVEVCPRSFVRIQKENVIPRREEEKSLRKSENSNCSGKEKNVKPVEFAKRDRTNDRNYRWKGKMSEQSHVGENGGKKSSEIVKSDKIVSDMRSIDFDSLEYVKMSDIYSEFPTNKKISINEDVTDNEEQFVPRGCPVM